MDETTQLDQIDRKIIHELERDGRMSFSELARRVGLSKTPCQVRLRRLREAGYILGFKAIADPAKLGLDHIAFLEVRLSDTTEPALQAFNTDVFHHKRFKGVRTGRQQAAEQQYTPESGYLFNY